MHMKNPASKAPTPIAQRLKLEMQKRGMTSSELARRAGVKTSFIYDILSGKSANPSTVKLALVADGLGISLTHLVEQAGIHHRSASTPRNDDYLSIPKLVVEVSTSGKPVLSTEQTDEPYCFRSIWVREHLGVSPANLRIFYVRGDSMEPTLHHNDVVLVDTSNQTPAPPGVFIVFDGLGLMPKRLEFTPGENPQRIRVIADNPQYSTYEISPGETYIIGRVVWFSREV